MRCKEQWQPSKFVFVNNALRGDPTGVHLSIGSRFVANLVAPHYQVALETNASGRLLDLGCGNVPLFSAYANFVDETVCVDWPTSFHEQRHIDVFADLTQPLPLRDSSFDTILLSDVLEHIPNPESLLFEMERVLRPGGKIIIGVPFLYWLHEIPHDFNRYTRFQLERMLHRIGLNIVQLTEIGGSPEVVVDVVSKTLASWPRLAGAFTRMADVFLRIPPVKKVSARTRSRFPITYIVVAEKSNV